MEKSTKKPAKSGQPWSQEDLSTLSDEYGLTPNDKLAKRLQRSASSIPPIAYRKLHLKETDNFITATELVRTLGIGKLDTIARWVRKGWLNSSCLHRGQSYCFTEEAVEECLRRRPWLVKLKLMERHYFRSIIEEEWDRDPWYIVTQAASLLRVSVQTIQNYIKRGWLSPHGHNPDGKTRTYIIRRSGIEAFLANDPRPSYWHNARVKQNKIRLKKQGRPTRVAMLWNFECPRCGKEVRIMAPPDMVGTEVREKFITIYVNGACFHSAEVELTVAG